MGVQSHFRRFTVDEWSAEPPPVDAWPIHYYHDGDVLAHCAGSRERWEAAYSGTAPGEFQGERLSDLPPATQRVATTQIIERAGRQQRISMATKPPRGWKVVGENLVAHLWSGQTEEDVR